MPSNEKESKRTRKQHIMFNLVCLHALKQSRISLESGLNYRPAKTNIDNDDQDDVKDHTFQLEENVNQCDKAMINQYLFQNYFKRS